MLCGLGSAMPVLVGRRNNIQNVVSVNSMAVSIFRDAIIDSIVLRQVRVCACIRH